MIRKKLARAAVVAALAVSPVCVAETAHASGGECSGAEYVGTASFNLCTYVDNNGGDGLYINYADVSVDTSQSGWTFPSGQNCLVQPALTLWYSNGFSTKLGPNYSCNTFKSDPSYTFALHQEQPSNENEVCATLFFPNYNQRVGYNDDCVGVHR